LKEALEQLRINKILTTGTAAVCARISCEVAGHPAINDVIAHTGSVPACGPPSIRARDRSHATRRSRPAGGPATRE
jgi:hypothetical protein